MKLHIGNINCRFSWEVVYSFRGPSPEDLNGLETKKVENRKVCVMMIFFGLPPSSQNVSTCLGFLTPRDRMSSKPLSKGPHDSCRAGRCTPCVNAFRTSNHKLHTATFFYLQIRFVNYS